MLLQVITSGCATFPPWAAAIGGIIGGLAVLPGSMFVSHVLKVDDPVDAFTVSTAACPHHNITACQYHNTTACDDHNITHQD